MPPPWGGGRPPRPAASGRRPVGRPPPRWGRPAGRCRCGGLGDAGAVGRAALPSPVGFRSGKKAIDEKGVLAGHPVCKPSPRPLDCLCSRAACPPHDYPSTTTDTAPGRTTSALTPAPTDEGQRYHHPPRRLGGQAYATLPGATVCAGGKRWACRAGPFQPHTLACVPLRRGGPPGHSPTAPTGLAEGGAGQLNGAVGGPCLHHHQPHATVALASMGGQMERTLSRGSGGTEQAPGGRHPTRQRRPSWDWPSAPPPPEPRATHRYNGGGPPLIRGGPPPCGPVWAPPSSPRVLPPGPRGGAQAPGGPPAPATPRRRCLFPAPPPPPPRRRGREAPRPGGPAGVRGRWCPPPPPAAGGG